MEQIEFIYKQNIILIQCHINDRMREIVNKFILKTFINKNSVIFLYSGNIINDELKLSEIIGKDKIDKMRILVYSLDNINNNKIIIKSKYIICPKCKENIKFKLNEYKIYLYECKNGHRIDDILLDEFEKTQYIDISKIECNICKEKRISNTYKNDFYKSLTCGINICPLCKSSHNKLHNIINYEQKNYICEKHNEIYIKYCDECKMNICIMCEKEHKNHRNISYGEIIPNYEKIKEYMKELRKSIDIFNKNIEKIIYKLEKVKENIEIYYNINNNIINNYVIKNRNYEILQNINEINNNIIEEINKINKDEDINNKIIKILNIYNKMTNKYVSEINIIYDIYKKNKKIEKENTINIFGGEFVKNNKNICKMIIDDEEYEIKEKYNIKKFNKNKLKIKFKGIDNVTDMSYMFNYCTSLSSLPDIAKWNTNNVTNMSYMFSGCSSLSSIPNISKWNTNNVTNMSYMFYNCSSLSSLSNISKWNVNNVTDMSNMFYNCSSLSSLPDISKWNINNVTDMSYMFNYCTSLSSLPDISKWNTNNITNMVGMFFGCSSLTSIPNISKWNTNKIININDMFSYCSSLSSLPNISKWNTNNVTNMSWMFFGCSSLSSLPDISKWITNNVTDMSYMFYYCSSLSSLLIFQNGILIMSLI